MVPVSSCNARRAAGADPPDERADAELLLYPLTRRRSTMPETRYDDLRALYVNCTLKRSPEPSNTEGLVNLSRRILEKHGVEVELVRAVDHNIATGVWRT
jgi:hypothetical protein